MLARSFVGLPETVQCDLRAFLAKTGADEVMVASAIHDHGARMSSYEILAEVGRNLRQLGAAETGTRRVA